MKTGAGQGPSVHFMTAPSIAGVRKSSGRGIAMMVVPAQTSTNSGIIKTGRRISKEHVRDLVACLASGPSLILGGAP